jgi:hypothetical protein
MWYPLYLRGIFFTSIAMWLENLGVFVVFAIFVCWFFLDWRQSKFYIPAIAVFLLCNEFRFQSDSRLNFIVLFPLWVIPAIVAILSAFTRMIAAPNHPLTRGAVCGWCILFVVLFTLSGVLGTKKQIGRTTPIWNEMEAEAAIWIQKNVPYDAGFVGLCSARDFTAVLTGRQIFCVDVNGSAHFGLGDSMVDVVANLWQNSAHVGALPPAVKYWVDSTGASETRFSHPWSIAFSNRGLKIYYRNF